MKSFTIALATAKETIRQPAFFVIAFFAAALLVATVFVPYFTFGEDYIMVNELVFDIIMITAATLGVLAAAMSITY